MSTHEPILIGLLTISKVYLNCPWGVYMQLNEEMVPGILGT